MAAHFGKPGIKPEWNLTNGLNARAPKLAKPVGDKCLGTNQADHRIDTGDGHPRLNKHYTDALEFDLAEADNHAIRSLAVEAGALTRGRGWTANLAQSPSLA